MSYRIGDSVFLSQGQPSLVIGRDPAKGTVILDREQDAIRDNARHGYLNGIAPERREEFLNLMDEIKSHPEATQRIDRLQAKIDELAVDPKNMQFVRYLEGEKNHLINMSGYRPRMYTAEEFKLR
ncbi:MAG: hypothetical protein NT027_05775 [Proteobacteria bacterium]|nr:hypothetical protein [Pseudomonadota bacterium]